MQMQMVASGTVFISWRSQCSYSVWVLWIHKVYTPNCSYESFISSSDFLFWDQTWAWCVLIHHPRFSPLQRRHHLQWHTPLYSHLLFLYPLHMLFRSLALSPTFPYTSLSLLSSHQSPPSSTVSLVWNDSLQYKPLFLAPRRLSCLLPSHLLFRLFSFSHTVFPSSFRSLSPPTLSHPNSFLPFYLCHRAFHFSNWISYRPFSLIPLLSQIKILYFYIIMFINLLPSYILQPKSITPPSCLPLTQWCPSQSHWVTLLFIPAITLHDMI